MKKSLLSFLITLTLLLGVQHPLLAANQAMQKDRLISEKVHQRCLPLFDFCMEQTRGKKKHHHHSSSSGHHHKHPQKEKICHHTVITKLPYTIRQPGYYTLCGNLGYNPRKPNTTAITINSSNVVLDLKNSTLFQQTGNNVPATGIFINPNFSSISIVGENGFIQGFQGWGINCPGPNDVIILQDFTLQGCGSDARVNAGDDTNAVFSIDGGINIGTIGTLPVITDLVSDIVISNIRVLNNKNSGLQVSNPEQLIIEDTVIDGTFSEVPSFGVTALQIIGPDQADPMPPIKNVQINRTTISNTFCRTIESFDPQFVPDGVLGVHAGGINNLSVTDSTFTGTFCAANNDDPKAPFIFFSLNFQIRGIENIVFNNCTFSDAQGDRWTVGVQNFHSSANTGSSPPDPGLLDTKGFVIKNCVASGTTGFYVSTGFSVYYNKNMVLENCQSMDHQLLTGGIPFIYEVLTNLVEITSSGFFIGGGAGFTDGASEKENKRGQCNQVIVKNCTANSCNSAVGPAFGFFYGGGPFFAFKSDGVTPSNPVNLKDISFIDCVAQNISSQADAPNGTAQGVAAGFMVDRGVTQPAATFGIVDPSLPLTAFKPADSLQNVYVNNCRTSDIHGAGTGLQYSGGIVMLGVGKATISNSSVTGTNNDGILLGGGPWWIDASTSIVPTVNSLVQANKAGNNLNHGYRDDAGTNTFVDNVANNNGTPQYSNVQNVIPNGNRQF